MSDSLEKVILLKKNIEKFIYRYWKAEDYYLAAEDPKNKADKVIQSDSNIAKI
jgi:uridine kinase